MATGAARGGNVVEIAAISYGHRTAHGQVITKALADLGYRNIDFIDINQMIKSAINKDGYPDRRCGG